jgi:hypothetical protein
MNLMSIVKASWWQIQHLLCWMLIVFSKRIQQAQKIIAIFDKGIIWQSLWLGKLPLFSNKILKDIWKDT